MNTAHTARRAALATAAAQLAARLGHAGAAAGGAARSGAVYAHGTKLVEDALASGIYLADFWLPAPHRVDEVQALRQRLDVITASRLMLLQHGDEADAIRVRLAEIPLDLVWHDTIHNLVTDEGARAMLTHALKGSSYTASQALFAVEDTGFSAYDAANTAANITAVGGGSPANGWNEAPVGTIATRGTPTFGTASSRSLATSAAVAFSTLATDTIKGAGLLIRSAAGVAPSTTVGNTSGALWSVGAFSGGDQAVSASGTLNVTYTTSL
jgi:hypothetical protein